jgi:intraflagellar transport protein 81
MLDPASETSVRQPLTSAETNEIKQIVDGLNREPFNLGLSLVDFDDKSPFELVELMNSVLGELDETQQASKHPDETPEAHNERVCGFLTVLGFPSDFNPSFKRDLKQGDKKTISNILFWILQRPQDLKRIAYTAKFLVEFQIPDEFQMDEEIREQQATYKQLQAEFTAAH